MAMMLALNMVFALVQAISVAMALRLVGWFEAKSFRAPSAPELLSLCGAKEKGNQRERPPRLALAAHPWAASP
ncbi:hypothetical protein [Rhodanobacter sp. OK091]|uniref:hypothetical protein n=1 Tax=Rhodanobacter sp. OK091 TaxID=1881037 RepID=UPI001160DCC1|nr:hypothetical protein [Rhodanobacter sp. OK091]